MHPVISRSSYLQKKNRYALGHAWCLLLLFFVVVAGGGFVVVVGFVFVSLFAQDKLCSSDLGFKGENEPLDQLL